ncbi:haloacid dehalogenase type II [Flavobacterium subsaxonicum]|uniref:HAD family hydrolase n=1 Tax=Flavobacterium subsaxonicum WB 4.1-42 = DSM 21790 TaxID=1121898 RepID=A0A0A2MLD4_9FLAO|nr:haloacid dehalogenase type II [Flavobacterium subsaxonicum]KGO92268.1 HAD family hydrolase [Flavobacterium subsaxonicum WB 4.1-42 = DSM 21790]
MNKDRRKFLAQAATISGIGLLSPLELLAAQTADSTEYQYPNPAERPKALFFDINETVLNLEPLKVSINTVLGNKPGLATLWFTTMLQYSLVVTAAGKYEDFGAIGAAALLMVAKNNGIALTQEQAKNAIKPILNLQPHPDVVSSLKKLKANGYKLVSFTNSSNKAVKTQLENAGLSAYFEQQLSIEDIGKFKPHTDAYNWAAKKLNLQNKDCMLIAAHGWDVAGAAWSGWRTAFIARPGQQLFPLAPEVEINEPNLTAIADKLCALK